MLVSKLVKLLFSAESTMIKLSIPLADVNDEKPVLKNQPFPYRATIPVGAHPGYIVYELLAVDPDTNSQLEYRIADEAGANFSF